jgi:hypothetical protein
MTVIILGLIFYVFGCVIANVRRDQPRIGKCLSTEKQQVFRLISTVILNPFKFRFNYLTGVPQHQRIFPLPLVYIVQDGNVPQEVSRLS